ncbi:hypothetical protein [uncultured Flavobacterium sp.]|uniref:hypothetical protein n=1 Tax=uncultured Flavobacterium sp. TaxID=165435 RepID=UPI0026010AC3|nr:hypothetical protein [uncultured Flavobacterium sp.]
MKKTCILIFSFLLLLSCDEGLNYSGETKYVFKGRLSDRNGQPLKGILLSVHLSKNGSPGAIGLPGDSNDYDLISYTRTDRDGYYRMVFPKPTNQDNIALGINTEAEGETENPDENFSNIYITNIQNSDLVDYMADFGERTIFDTDDTTTLTVTFTNAYLDFMAVPEGLVNNAIEMFDNSLHGFYQTGYGSGVATFTFEVARNQNIILRYGNDGFFSTIQEINIPIGNEPVAQTINL